MSKLSLANKVYTAISTLNESSGSSLPAIVKFVQSNYKGTSAGNVKTQVKRLVDSEQLLKTKNSYKLTKESKAALEKIAKKPELPLKVQTSPSLKNSVKKPASKKVVVKKASAKKVVKAKEALKNTLPKPVENTKKPQVLVSVPPPIPESPTKVARTPSPVKGTPSPNATTHSPKVIKVTKVPSQIKAPSPKKTVRPKVESKKLPKNPKKIEKTINVSPRSKGITRS